LLTALAWGAEPEVAPAQAALLWQGFEHYWEREVLGAWRLPHRVSLFENRVDPGSTEQTPDGLVTETTFTFAQSTGVDGDWMNPKGYVARIASSDLIVHTGVATVSAVDEVSGEHPKSMHPFHEVLVVPVPPSDRPRTGVALLQGLEFHSKCVEGPPEGCNSNGIWPYRFRVDLAPCQDLGDRLACPLTVEVGRAWTPAKGGLKGVEIKPVNPRMSLDVSVAWVVLAAPSDRVLAHRSLFENALPTNRQILFEEQIAHVDGLPAGFPKAAVGLTGLAFEFFPSGRREGLQQRGRYIGGWGLQVRTAAYDPDAGTLDIGHSGGIWLPKTVRGTGVSIEVGMVVLQLADPHADVVEAVAAEGALCSNSHGAPGFSAWEKCDEVLGEERTEQVVPVRIPAAP
jgi:hypothetical protein